MQTYPYIDKLTEKYNKAINTNAKEVKLSTIEIGLLLQDITRVSVSVTETNSNNLLLKQSVDMLVDIIKAMSAEGDDGF